MPEKLVIALGILVIQALEAFLFIRGLKIPGRWGLWVVALFILFNLPLPYVLWLQSGARQPSTPIAALAVRPFFAWQFNWLCFLFFLAPLIILGRAGAWLFGWEVIINVLRWLICGLAAAGALLTVFGLVNTVKPPEIKTIEIALPGLPPDQDGLRVAQLSDLHVAWWNSRAEFQRIGRMVADLRPDLLVITGDMVDHNPDYVEVVAGGLEKVRPRLGRYAVIGNHDIYTGREAVARRMEKNGFKMLRGECVSLKEKGAAVSLAGYDDSGKSWTSGDPAENMVPTALAQCDPDLPVILLAHRPPRFEKIENSRISLALAGQTHGGQFRLPFDGPGLADLTFPHASGLYQENGKSLYVTHGTGTVGWPFRLFCPPEITLIVLRSSPLPRPAEN